MYNVSTRLKLVSDERVFFFPFFLSFLLIFPPWKLKIGGDSHYFWLELAHRGCCLPGLSQDAFLVYFAPSVFCNNHTKLTVALWLTCNGEMISSIWVGGSRRCRMWRKGSIFSPSTSNTTTENLEQHDKEGRVFGREGVSRPSGYARGRLRVSVRGV